MSNNDRAFVEEKMGVSSGLTLDEGIRWGVKWQVDKYVGNWTPEQIDRGEAGQPFEVVEIDGNLLMHGGASLLWQALIGNGGAGDLEYMDNANAHIGVGDSNTAAAATQTDLQASTNKVRKAMDATYPQHTDGTASGNASIVFRSTFGTSDANFDWEEWALFNAASSGRMLNRKVQSIGTKNNLHTWVVTATLTLS